MIKFIAFTCCTTCEHKKEEKKYNGEWIVCDLDNSKTNDNLVCGQWKMNEYLKKFTGKE